MGVGKDVVFVMVPLLEAGVDVLSIEIIEVLATSGRAPPTPGLR